MLVEAEDNGSDDAVAHRERVARRVSNIVSAREARVEGTAKRVPSRYELPDLLTADEMAAVLRTTRKAIYARLERGLLPGVVRDGRRVLFDREVVLRWVCQKYAPSSEGVGR